jgi:hypothetical protein
MGPGSCFKTADRDLLTASQGLSLDDVAELIEHVEGALYR